MLYRLGDFFECFFEDAITLSQLLEITLTSKEGGKKIGKVPMAGIPHHASDRYCTELIKKGLSIAICDQLEAAPSKGNKLIKRGITRLITPGTILEEGMLKAKQNNRLVSVIVEPTSNPEIINWSLAKIDVSTGEFIVQEGKDTKDLRQELIKLNAAEVISEKNSISSFTLPFKTLRYGVSRKPYSFVLAYTAKELISPIFGPSGVSIGQTRP